MNISARRTSRGFTLLELLVVIAIIGVLSTIITVVLNTARQGGRDARRVADLNEIRTAMQLYLDANSMYPSALSDVVPAFLPVLPLDPSSGQAYFYDQIGGGTSYHVGANLENATHDALQSDLDSVSDSMNGGDASDCGGGSTTGYRCYDVGP
jgi:general secretion pathway protein G